MWKKIYLLAFGFFVAISAFLSWYAWSWLQSIGSPIDALVNYSYFAGIGWTFVLLSSAILLVAANVILWTTRNSWALWITLAYFCVFTLIRYFLLERVAHSFATDARITDFGSTWSPVIGVGISIAAAAVVFIDQLVVTRMNTAIFPDKPLERELTETENDLIEKEAE